MHLVKHLPAGQALKQRDMQIDPSKGYKGITCFVATKDMGVQIAKKEQKLGIRASSTCTLNFDDIRVPAENVIGGEGKGYKVSYPRGSGMHGYLSDFDRLPSRF
jgi:hypothetical protein